MEFMTINPSFTPRCDLKSAGADSTKTLVDLDTKSVISGPKVCNDDCKS